MAKETDSSPWQERSVPLRDVVLSNSWALQAILNYLEEIHPGARDRIWDHYLELKQMAEETKNQKPNEERKEAESNGISD